jgi:hypothetical protein
MGKQKRCEARQKDEFGDAEIPECVGHPRAWYLDDDDGRGPEDYDPATLGRIDYTFGWLLDDGEVHEVRVRGNSYNEAARRARAALPGLLEKVGAGLDRLAWVQQWDDLSDAREAHSGLRVVFGDLF